MRVCRLICNALPAANTEKGRKKMNLFGLTALAAETTATTTDAAAAQGSAASSMIMQGVLLVGIIVLFYFMLIRPQRKREKEAKAMVDAMKVGDKIVTIGGICGKVVKIKDSYCWVETGNIGTQDEKSVIKFERDAIKTVEKKQTN